MGIKIRDKSIKRYFIFGCEFTATTHLRDSFLQQNIPLDIPNPNTQKYSQNIRHLNRTILYEAGGDLDLIPSHDAIMELQTNSFINNEIKAILEKPIDGMFWGRYDPLLAFTLPLYFPYLDPSEDIYLITSYRKEYIILDKMKQYLYLSQERLKELIHEYQIRTIQTVELFTDYFS